MYSPLSSAEQKGIKDVLAFFASTSGVKWDEHVIIEEMTLVSLRRDSRLQEREGGREGEFVSRTKMRPRRRAGAEDEKEARLAAGEALQYSAREQEQEENWKRRGSGEQKMRRRAARRAAGAAEYGRLMVGVLAPNPQDETALRILASYLEAIRSSAMTDLIQRKVPWAKLQAVYLAAYARDYSRLASLNVTATVLNQTLKSVVSPVMDEAKKKGCPEGIIKCFGNVFIGVGVFVGTVTCGFMSYMLYGRRRTSRSSLSSNTRNEERSILASIIPSTQAQRDRALQVPPLPKKHTYTPRA